MRYHRIARLALAMGLAVGLLPGVATGVDVAEFKGSITDVGIVRGPGQIGGVEFRIRGVFALDRSLDLSRATLRIGRLLAELGRSGGGELLRTVDGAPILPIVLAAREGSEVEKAVFETPGSFRPQFRFQIQRRDEVYEFRLKVDRALIPVRPRRCPPQIEEAETQLTHTFTINDGVLPAVVVSTRQRWECTKPGRYHMRTSSPEPPASPPRPGPSPSPVPQPGPGPLPGPVPAPGPVPPPQPQPPPAPPPVENRPPAASLKTEAVTRNTGSPDLVELDGTDSVDPDGVVVRYRFESGDGRVQDGPSPIARFVYEPGDYRPRLTVFDDRGAASPAVTRGYSEK